MLLLRLVNVLSLLGGSMIQRIFISLCVMATTQACTSKSSFEAMPSNDPGSARQIPPPAAAISNPIGTNNDPGQPSSPNQPAPSSSPAPSASPSSAPSPSGLPGSGP